MAFLLIDDYYPHIKAEILAKFTEGDDTKRTDMELRVQEEISMALRIRYDVPNIFNQAGANRNQYLIVMMVNMVVYRLAKRLNPGQITESIKDDYVNAKTDLDRIAQGNYQIDLPLVGDTDSNGTDDRNVMQSGGLPPRNPYF
jgi:phage gp36-like protein